MADNTTKLTNMINPQVLAEMISAKLPSQLRFLKLAKVIDNLKGQAGNTLTFPAFVYSGDASVVAEGESITIDKLTTSQKPVTVIKWGKGLTVTDEAVLSGYGDVLGECVNQCVLAISNKVDNDFISACSESLQTSDAPLGLTVQALQTAIDVFSDEDDEQMILICNPKTAGFLRLNAGESFLAATEVGANNFVKGVYGEILGAQIVRSNKVNEDTAYIIKAGALALVMKRDVQVETDRDITKSSTTIVATLHGATYLYDPTKVVKINITVEEGEGDGDGGGTPENPDPPEGGGGGTPENPDPPEGGGGGTPEGGEG